MMFKKAGLGTAVIFLIGIAILVAAVIYFGKP